MNDPRRALSEIDYLLNKHGLLILAESIQNNTIGTPEGGSDIPRLTLVSDDFHINFINRLKGATPMKKSVFKAVVWLSLSYFLPGSGVASASDTFNLCYPHDTPQGTLVDLPADDAPKFFSDGPHVGPRGVVEMNPVQTYFFNGNFKTLNHHEYGFGLTYLTLFDTIVFAVGNITDVTNQTYHHKAWVSFSSPLPRAIDSFNLILPSEPTSLDAPVTTGENGQVDLHMTIDGITVDLSLESVKDPAYFFHNGFGAYIDPATNTDVGSNYYYARPRNLVYGKIKANGKKKMVAGEAWAERQFMIAPQGDVKWVWHAIRLNNGEELMVYDIQMRQTGETVIHTGTFIGKPPSCNAEELEPEDIIMTSIGSYTSPHSGHVYPTSFRVEVPSKDLDITLTPTVQDQELYNLLGAAAPTWAGGAEVEGTRNGHPVIGNAEIQLLGFGSPPPF